MCDSEKRSGPDLHPNMSAAYALIANPTPLGTRSASGAHVEP